MPTNKQKTLPLNCDVTTNEKLPHNNNNNRAERCFINKSDLFSKHDTNEVIPN